MRSSTTTFTLSVLALIPLLGSCVSRPRIIVIPEDREVRWLAPGETHTTANGVWLVPDARMRDILLKLNK